MRLIFEQDAALETVEPGNNGETAESGGEAERPGGAKSNDESKPVVEERLPIPQRIISEEQALRELPAIPIYFASSYSLVKPYIVGFDANLLDAPSLKHVRINTSWQPPKPAPVAWTK